MVRLISYTLVGISHPSSHISSPTEVYFDSEKYSNSIQQLGGRLKYKSRQVKAYIFSMHYAQTRCFFFFFTRTEYNWVHNCSINDLNQRIGCSTAIRTRREPRTAGEKKKQDNERARDFFFGKGGETLDTFFSLNG